MWPSVQRPRWCLGLLFFSVQAEDMIAEIKKAFIGNLPHVNWMDEETKTQALKKVRRASQYCHNIILLAQDSFNHKCHFLFHSGLLDLWYDWLSNMGRRFRRTRQILRKCKSLSWDRKAWYIWIYLQICTVSWITFQSLPSWNSYCL